MLLYEFLALLAQISDFALLVFSIVDNVLANLAEWQIISGKIYLKFPDD